MARPRIHTREEIIVSAMDYFWIHGYESSSISKIENATGVSRSTLYNNWDDKDDLFLSVLHSYHLQGVEMMKELKLANGVNEIINFINSLKIVSPETEIHNCGCLITSTATDVEFKNEQIQKVIKSYHSEQLKVFLLGLTNSNSRGELDCPMPLENAVEFIVGSLWGIFTIIRLYRNPQKVSSFIDGLVQTIESWKI